MSNSKKRFLLVDDEPELLTMYGSFYGDWFEGCDVMLAKDGVEAVELLKAHKFDLISTDFRMPNMGGEELIKWIRFQDSPNKESPILLVTAFPSEARDLANEFGIYLAPKPVSYEELEKTAKLLVRAHALKAG